MVETNADYNSCQFNVPIYGARVYFCKTVCGFLAIAFSLSLTQSRLANAQFQDAREALTRSLEQRLSLVSGECLITGSLQTATEVDTENSLLYTFDFSIPAFKIEDRHKGTFLRTNEFYFRMYQQQKKAIERSSSSEVPAARSGAFDIRTIGLLYMPTIPVAIECVDFPHLMSRYLSSTDYEIHTESDSVHVSFVDRLEDAHFDSICHIWLDPTRDFVSTRFEVEHPQKPHEVIYRSEISWEKVDAVWVPIGLTQSSGPSMPIYSLDWKFDWKAVNSPLPGSTFESKSLLIDEPKAVVYVVPKESDRPVEVDVVKRDDYEEVTAIEPVPEKRIGRPIILLLTGSALLLVGILAVLRYVFGKR
jgi:hypothetical protein